jgi:tape measure domain-containing protein
MAAAALRLLLDIDVSTALAKTARVKNEIAGFSRQPLVPSNSIQPTKLPPQPKQPLKQSGQDNLNPVNPRAKGDVSTLNQGLAATRSHLLSIGLAAATAFAAFTTGVVALSTAAVIKLGVQAEQTRLQFQTMLGDASKGNAMLGVLNQYADVTPFSNAEVIQSGKTLLAFGVEAQNVMGVMKITGDVASGTGKSFTELSTIIGKTYAKGKADSEVLNQLTEAGVPIIKTLGEMYGKTGLEIYKMAENGQISSGMVIAAFQKMTSEGGVFANMMDKQSQTTGGLWSTLTGTLEYTASIIGESLNPLLQAGLKTLIDWAEKIKTMAQDGTIIQYIATIGFTGVEVFGTLISWLTKFYNYGVAIWKTLVNVWQAEIEGFQAVVVGAFALIVKGALAAINKMIEIANNAPGINIGLVKEPKFLEDMKQYSKLSADEAKNNLEEALSGNHFADANKQIAEVEKKVAAVQNKLNKGIEDWQSGAHEKQSQEAADKKKYEPDFNKPLAGNKALPPLADKPLKETAQFDRLAKIGAYNAIGAMAQVNSIDVERNILLKNILAALKTAPEKEQEKPRYKVA